MQNRLLERDYILCVDQYLESKDIFHRARADYRRELLELHNLNAMPDERLDKKQGLETSVSDLHQSYLASKQDLIEAKTRYLNHPLFKEMNQRVEEYNAEREKELQSYANAYYQKLQPQVREVVDPAEPAKALDLKHLKIAVERSDKKNHPERYKNARSYEGKMKLAKQTKFAYHKLSLFDRKGFGAKTNIKRQLVEHEQFLEGIELKHKR